MLKKITFIIIVILTLSIFSLITLASNDFSILPKISQLDENPLKEYIEGLPEIEMTLAHNDVADPTQLIQAMCLAFQESVEAASDGKIKAKAFLYR